jgi:hypothetical protein
MRCSIKCAPTPNRLHKKKLSSIYNCKHLKIFMLYILSTMTLQTVLASKNNIIAAALFERKMTAV